MQNKIHEGRNIKRFREMLGIKQGELAEKVSRYEREEATTVGGSGCEDRRRPQRIARLPGGQYVLLDKSILDKVVAIQKLPDEGRSHIMYSLDGLIQHAKTRLAYK